MHFPITLATAGVLGIILVILSLNVSLKRAASKTILGDGQNRPDGEKLFIACRAQANFVEYVPLALILLAGIEAAGAPVFLVAFLCVALVIARIIHPIGMGRAAPNLLRAGGAVLTWATILVASVAALVRVF